MKKIKVIIKRPDSKPYVTHISPGFKNLQATVGGFLEEFKLASDMVLLCDEEGKLKRLPKNCSVCGVDFVGAVIFAGVKDGEISDIPCSFSNFKKLFRHLFYAEGEK